MIQLVIAHLVNYFFPCVGADLEGGEGLNPLSLKE